MDRKLIAIAGAAAVLATAPAVAQPASPEAPIVPAAKSYAELLEPIADASNRLTISDAQAAARRPALQQIQYDRDERNEHHHHHHHHHSNDWYAQNGYRFFGGRWETPDYYEHHHHHHHHHHHSQDRDDR